jgi:hypothetical protein
MPDRIQTASYEITARDLIAGYRLNFLSALKGRKVWVRCAVLTILLGAGSAFLFADDLGIAIGALIGVAYGALLLSVIWLTCFLLLPRRARRIFAQQKALHDPIAIEWSEALITIGSNRGTTTFEWSDFVRSLENHEIILLFQSDAVFNFIPKRALSPEQAASIIAHARSGIPTKQR